jgi:hypothetical protein
MISAANQTLSQRWALTLTNAQRADWQTLFDAGPYDGSLAVPAPDTARRLFIRVNLIRRLRALAILDAAPADQAGTALATVTATITTGPVFSLAFTVSALAAGSRILLLAGAPYPPSDPPGLSRLRRVGFSADAQATPWNALAAYAALFGNPVSGKAIRFQAATVVDANGAITAAVDHIITVA